MDIKTAQGTSLDEFFKKKLPSNFKLNESILLYKLELLARNGRDCIGAFVFPYEDYFYFMIDDSLIEASSTANVLFSFIDQKNIILIFDIIVTYK